MQLHLKVLLYFEEVCRFEKQSLISSLVRTYCVLKSYAERLKQIFSNYPAIFDLLSFFIGKNKSGGDAYISLPLKNLE